MISVVYLGKNPQTEERLKYIPGRLVKVAKTYREAASICLPRLHNEHFILLYEKGIRNEDITAISYIKKKCKTIYIILLTEAIPDEERKAYQKCGINDTLSVNASITEINKKIQFISDRENVMFDSEAPKYKILKFGKELLISSSLCWGLSFSRRYSSRRPSPSNWRAKVLSSSNRSVWGRTILFLTS